jgi:hypothetical protein
MRPMLHPVERISFIDFGAQEKQPVQLRKMTDCLETRDRDRQVDRQTKRDGTYFMTSETKGSFIIAGATNHFTSES